MKQAMWEGSTIVNKMCRWPYEDTRGIEFHTSIHFKETFKIKCPLNYEETILRNMQRIREMTTYKAICNVIG
jgi:hypothetical protein